MGAFDLLLESCGNAQRLALIADIPLAEIVSAPAHRRLRNPGAVRELSSRLRAGDLGVVLQEPFLIGIFTHRRAGEVSLRAVECLDGHHRLLAGLLSGVWKRVADIPAEQMETRADGRPPDSLAPEDRWIPLEAARASTLSASEWCELPQGGQVRGATAVVSGELSSVDEVFAQEHRGIPLAELLRELERS